MTKEQKLAVREAARTATDAIKDLKGMQRESGQPRWRDNGQAGLRLVVLKGIATTLCAAIAHSRGRVHITRFPVKAATTGYPQTVNSWDELVELATRYATKLEADGIARQASA